MTTEREWLYELLRSMEKVPPQNPTPVSTPSDEETEGNSPPQPIS